MRIEEFEPRWTALRDQVIAYLEGLGKTLDAFGKKDFWVVDDHLYMAIVRIEIMDLDLLAPATIYGLRELLKDDPGFAITVSVVPPDGAKWPGMGISLFKGEIIDGLKRAFLPEPYRNLHYLGSRPD